MVGWAFWNIVIAKAIQISYFEQYQWAIWGFLIFMISLFVMQLLLSIISMFRDCYRNTLIKSHKSDYFKRVSLLIITCCQVLHLFLLNQKLNSYNWYISFSSSFVSLSIKIQYSWSTCITQGKLNTIRIPIFECTLIKMTRSQCLECQGIHCRSHAMHLKAHLI